MPLSANDKLFVWQLYPLNGAVFGIGRDDYVVAQRWVNLIFMGAICKNIVLLENGFELRVVHDFHGVTIAFAAIIVGATRN